MIKLSIDQSRSVGIPEFDLYLNSIVQVNVFIHLKGICTEPNFPTLAVTPLKLYFKVMLSHTGALIENPSYPISNYMWNLV